MAVKKIATTDISENLLEKLEKPVASAEISTHAARYTPPGGGIGKWI